MNPYVTLNSKKYKVASPHYSKVPDKAVTVRHTVDGDVDRVHGPTIWRYAMVLRVPHANPPSGYGALSDLVTAFTAQSDLAFADIDGASHTAVFEKMGKPEPVNALLVWYRVPVEVVVVT